MWERSRPAQQRRAGRAGHRHAGGLAQRLTGPARWLCPTRSGNKHGHCDPDETAAKTRKLRSLTRSINIRWHSSRLHADVREPGGRQGPYTPKMMMCVFQNPMMSVPGSATVAKALSKLETLVVIDTMMSETAKLADYVLPGTTYLERYTSTPTG